MKQGICQIPLLITLLLLWVMPAYAVVEIKASVDRNPVSLSESFQIIFSANESPDDDPDFSVLEKDFEILNRSQSTQSSWINGQSSKTIKWELTVMAKNAGSLIIPPVRFGDDRSQATTILVTRSAPSQNLDSNQAIFMEVEATPENPVVQSQVIYTMRLYHRVQIAQASLSEPTLNDAVIEKLGEDKKYTTQINSVNYSVYEQKFAIFPQKSGTTIIPPMQLTAEVLVSGRPRFNGFFNRQTTRTQRIRSEAVTLNVQPIPASFKSAHWLPAEELHLREEWSGDITRMKPGEPLTRTLTLLAKATTVGQLPELHQDPKNPKLKTYPDQPALKEDKSGDGLIAFREEKTAFIPSEAGQYQLPAIEVPWFNTKTQTMETARIEAATLMVQPGAAEPAKTTPVASVPDQAKPDVQIEQPSIQESNPFWIWLCAFLATGWLVTLVYFLRKNKVSAEPEPEQPAKAKAQDFNKQLKQACEKNDAQAAKAIIISWGQQQLNESSLGSIAQLCDQDLKTELLYLNQCLYSAQPRAWNGYRLYQAFLDNKLVGNQQKQTDDGLEPLFKV